MNDFKTPYSLVIKFDDGKVFYDDKSYIPIESTSIRPNLQHFKNNIFWDIKVLRYNNDTNSLFAEILNYRAREYQFKQQPSYNIDIKEISFHSIDTAGITQCQKDRTKKTSTKKEGFDKGRLERTYPTQSDKKYLSKSNKLQTPEKEIKNIPLSVPIKELTFNQGSIGYEGNISGKPRVRLQINNPNIHPQFSSIRKYLFTANKINIDLELEVEKDVWGNINKVNVLKASSREIERIDEQMLESIKLDNLIATFFKPQRDEEANNTLYPIDEFIEDGVHSNLRPNDISTEEVLTQILEKKKPKHYHQLSYLSKFHKLDVFKLRFLPKPFSFLFLLEGKTRYHFILETSEEELATYVWHVDKEGNALNMKFEEIEQHIKAFEGSNRMAYINSKPDNFSRVVHDYKDNGFIKWKEKLNGVLT